MLKKIESIIFESKSRDAMTQEAMENITGLLSDTFNGSDENNLKQEFPEGIKMEQLTLRNRHVALYIDHMSFEFPSIDISVDILFAKTDIELGTYSLIFNTKGEQIDEILNIN